MGGKLSKISEASAPRVDPSISDNDTNLHYKSENMSHEAASHADSQLKIFDTILLQRMSRAVSSLSTDEAVRSVSFESLKEITTCFLEMNQEVVKIILECKKDIWKTPELFDLVEEYLENSLQTLDFCSALERCLMRARDSQLIINVALQRLEEEVNYEKTLEDLRLFMADGNPFTEEFFREFHSVYLQQRSMLEKMMSRKRKLDKKLKSIRAWRRVSCVIFAATFASVLVCSVVAAVLAAPPVAAALAAASSVPLGSMGRWFDSLLKHYEDTFIGEKEVVSSMQVGTFLAIKDLESIRVMVDQLEIQISYLLHCVDFTLEKEEAVRFGVEEIRRKLGVFMKSIEDLGEQADRCSRDIRRARTVVLQRIIRYPKE